MGRRLGRDWSEALGQGLRNLTGVTRRPHAGAVDAAAPAVEEYAVGHHVQVLFPMVDHIVAQQDFAETRSVDLHARVPFITLDRCGAAEDHAAAGAAYHFGADAPKSRIDRDRFLRYASLEKRSGHAIGSPRFLRAGV